MIVCSFFSTWWECKVCTPLTRANIHMYKWFNKMEKTHTNTLHLFKLLSVCLLQNKLYYYLTYRLVRRNKRKVTQSNQENAITQNMTYRNEQNVLDVYSLASISFKYTLFLATYTLMMWNEVRKHELQWMRSILPAMMYVVSLRAEFDQMNNKIGLGRESHWNYCCTRWRRERERMPGEKKWRKVYVSTSTVVQVDEVQPFSRCCDCMNTERERTSTNRSRIRFVLNGTMCTGVILTRVECKRASERANVKYERRRRRRRCCTYLRRAKRAGRCSSSSSCSSCNTHSPIKRRPTRGKAKLKAVHLTGEQVNGSQARRRKKKCKDILMQV